MDSNGSASQLPPTMPTSGAHIPGTQAGIDELSEKQLTPEVLQILMTFLRKNGLSVIPIMLLLSTNTST